MAWWAWAQVGVGGNDGVFAGSFEGIDEQGCCLILIRLKVMDRKNGGLLKQVPPCGLVNEMCPSCCLCHLASQNIRTPLTIPYKVQAVLLKSGPWLARIMSDETGKPRRIGVEESIAVRWSIAEDTKKSH
jgi:hypothetical protein